MIKLLLLSLLAFSVHAVELERNNVLQHARAKIQPTKEQSGVIACMFKLDDVSDEWIELSGWLVATNNNKRATGVTFELMQWDGEMWRALRSAPNSSQRGGGNLTKAQHHGVYTTKADYVAEGYVGEKWFAAIVWAYLKPDPRGHLLLDACQIRAVRHKN
jgi:hypothetical protein